MNVCPNHSGRHRVARTARIHCQPIGTSLLPPSRLSPPFFIPPFTRSLYSSLSVKACLCPAPPRVQSHPSIVIITLPCNPTRPRYSPTPFVRLITVMKQKGHGAPRMLLDGWKPDRLPLSTRCSPFDIASANTDEPAPNHKDDLRETSVPPSSKLFGPPKLGPSRPRSPEPAHSSLLPQILWLSSCHPSLPTITFVFTCLHLSSQAIPPSFRCVPIPSV